MKKLHIVGNWKMSLNKEDSLKLAHNIKLINNKDNLNIEVAPTTITGKLIIFFNFFSIHRIHHRN